MLKIVLILGLLLTGCMYETSDTQLEDEEMAPPKVSGWSQGGHLTPGDVSQGVPLQVQFQEAGNYTVQFFVNDLNEPPEPAFIRARAEITWSVNGQDVRRVIDCINGMSIQGVGQAVKVRIYDDSRITGFPDAQPYFVSAQVARGSRPSVQQPPYYTSDLIGLPAGPDSVVYDIPKNAGAISVMATVAPGTIGSAIGAYDILLQQRSVDGGGLLKSYDPRQESWVPLAAGANVIQLVSSAAAPDTVWTLAFGIDG